MGEGIDFAWFQAALAFDNIPSWKAEDDAFWAWKPQRLRDATEQFETVDGRNPANHLGCTKPVVNNGISTISTG